MVKDSEKKREKTIQKIHKLRKHAAYWASEFHRTRGEEWANAMTHLAGTLFSVMALTMMCIFSVQRGSAIHIVSCAIYGASLIILYNSSTFYHLVSDNRVKEVFQVFDHVSIYLLIAGTYTPLSLISLGGAKGWTVFGIVWGLAVFGILIETVLKKLRWMSLIIYLAMGWLVVGFFKAFAAGLAMPGLVMLVVGGVVYTLGVVFYVMDRVPYMHTVWHLFVLGGSVCHWIAINFYVIPS